MATEHIHRGKRIVGLLLVALGLVGALESPMPPISSAHATDLAMGRSLDAAAHQLGWPPTVWMRPDLPGRAYGIADARHSAGTPSLWAAISVMDSAGEPTLLDRLEQEGMPRGLFHGWEAIIGHPGDSLAAKGRLATRGAIAWRCGPYVLAVEDATGRGREGEIAEALHVAAQQHLYPLGSTVVVLAEADQTRGQNAPSRFHDLGQRVNAYYQHNGYGRVHLDWTFVPADGAEGEAAWVNMGPSFATYANGIALGSAALATALSAMPLPEEVYVERAIVVYAGQGQKADPTSPLFPSAYRLAEGRVVEVQRRGHASRLHVPNLVLLSEHDPLGTWAHEVGHTLYARYSTSGGFRRLSDRYDDRMGGQMGFWDLMGYGSHWGDPPGSAPTHMSSYTKEAAGWLHYREAPPDGAVVLTALESQGIGDAVLKVDDPAQQDERSFYIVEARDSSVPFGAIRTGIVVYYVTYDRAGGHAVVDLVTSRHSPLSTSDDASIALADSLRVKILGESFSPYQVTVHIERGTQASHPPFGEVISRAGK